MDPITLQDLIDAANAPTDGQTPAQAVAARLAEAPGDTDVQALIDAAVAKFEELQAGGVATDDELAAVEALADVAEGARTEVARREEIASERANRIQELAKRVKPEGSEPAESGGDGEDPDTGGDGEGGEPDPAAPADPAPATEPAPADPAPAPADAAPAPAPEPVLASAGPRRRPVRLADLPQREVRRPDPTPAGVVILAAAEVEGYAAGAPMADLAAVARAGSAKFDAMPQGVVPNTRVTAGIASFATRFPDELIVRNDKDAEEVMDRAVDQSRLPQKSLVAAGGWCSPSERLYELSPILADANAGLIDLPEVQAPRGGLLWTEGPDYTAIYNGTGFIQTEAQAIAGSGFTTAVGGTVSGTTKPIYRVPCPDSWNEKRTEAIGFGINGGILQHDAWSELTEDVIAHALIAHSHRVNARTLARQVADAGSAITLSLGPSATPQLLNSIEIQIEDVRYANRLGDGTTLEVVLPRWVRPLIRADQSIRTNSSTSEAYDVADAKITDWFAKRNAVVRWVYDWQDAFTGTSGGFGGASAITAWPTTVDALIYIAGTYVRSRGDVITMQAVYDTTNLAVNDVLHLFVEEKLLVIKRRYKPRLLRIALSANGSTAAGQVLDAQGKIVVPDPE